MKDTTKHIEGMVFMKVSKYTVNKFNSSQVVTGLIRKYFADLVCRPDFLVFFMDFD